MAELEGDLDPTRTRARGRRLVILLVALLAVYSCGSSDEPEPPSTTAESDVGAVIVADEYTFTPAVLSIDDAGTVLLRNDGGLAHTWTVLQGTIDSEVEITGDVILAEGTVEVGQTAQIDIGSIPPGRYQVVCAIPGHFSAGMEGELVVGGGE